ncbi:MAG: hypothetical protein IPK78_11995, partial [Rhodospirillales bacterium]|nr:hypothetical protein [Rhodospirillales bacterium]
MNWSRTVAMAALCLVALATSGGARAADPVLRDNAFLTCADVNAMPAEQRKTLTLGIADRANDYYQSTIADSAAVGEKIGWLIRSACTIAPEAYYSTVVARAVRVAGGGTEPPLQQPLDMNQAIFITCSGTKALPAEQLKQIGSFIGNEAAAHYGLTPGPTWTPDYIAALVYNGCQMSPDSVLFGNDRSRHPRGIGECLPAPSVSP